MNAALLTSATTVVTCIHEAAKAKGNMNLRAFLFLISCLLVPVGKSVQLGLGVEVVLPEMTDTNCVVDDYGKDGKRRRPARGYFFNLVVIVSGQSVC